MLSDIPLLVILILEILGFIACLCIGLAATIWTIVMVCKVMNWRDRL
jgi:hypothetical protein